MENSWDQLVAACARAEEVDPRHEGLFPTPILVLAHAISEHWDAPLTSPVVQEHLRVAEAAAEVPGTTSIVCTQSIEDFVTAIWDGDLEALERAAAQHFDHEHRLFLQRRNSVSRPRHPWSGLIRAYLRRPDDIVPNTRNRRILPSRLAMSTDESRVPHLFSPPAHVSPDGRGVLPLFGTDTAPPVAWPLELYRMGGGTDAQKGRGISMPLRIFTEAVLFVKPPDRDGRPKAFDYSLRKLLALLYPNGPPGASVYWPRLVRAAKVLDATKVPVFNQVTGRHSLRRIVSIGGMPNSPTSLEDEVRIVVDLPPGSEFGPQVPDSLRLLATSNADMWRLLFHLCYHWHKPGVSVRPQGRRADGRGMFWGQSRNPNDYMPVDDDMLTAMTNPVSGIKQRKSRLLRARAALEQLADAGEVISVNEGRNRLILPPGTVISEQ